MKTIKTIKTETMDIQFGYWDNEKEEFIPIEKADQCEDQVSRWLLDLLMINFANLQHAIYEDLKTVWERLDRIESN